MNRSQCSACLFRVAFLTLFSLTLVADARAEDDYKLQPLKYNHPGLTVDLGVGLWAFPLPLDYDQDGDMDLLVGCPDKPSNGVYFFENPGDSPNPHMPVFKPGVRLGKAYHFMILSHRGDEPVVMRAGHEYRLDPTTQRFDFAKGQSISIPFQPEKDFDGRIRGRMWRYVDYDGDGDHDLILGLGDWSDLAWDHAYDNQGRWRNGPLHGYVYLVENQGNDDEPKYSDDPQRIQAGGGDVDVYGWPCPNFADFDGDGDLDLLCGEFMDGFTYFQNTGSRTQPAYAAGVRLQNEQGEPLIMHLQMITPTAVDWDADGDFDLIVGDEDGRVAWVENTGKLDGNIPVFRSPQYFQQQADTLKFGALATPYAYDWDGDGDEDILCGNTAGSIGFFENMGLADNGLPKWNAPRLLQVKKEDGSQEDFRVLAGPSGSIQGPCEAKWGYTTLSVADWDRDGDADILYNSILSRLGMISSESGTLVDRPFDSGLEELPPKWYWWQRPTSSGITQWRTTPLMIDFDQDKKLDLVLLDQEGYLTLRRGGGKAERIFVDESLKPIRLNAGSCGRSGRVKLAMGDWDQDGRVDLLVNSENATFYRNCQDVDGKVILKRVGNVARRNVAGHTSSPAVCDFDGNGVIDLLVGSENGRIYHLKHQDAVSFSEEQLTAKVNKTAKPIHPSIPAVVKQEFVFEKAKHDQCHAATISVTSRGLVTAWFGGRKEGHESVGIWSSYHDGLRWSTPVEVASGVQHDGLRYPCWNPVLFQPPGDAPTILFFKVGPNPREWWGETMVSYDRGRTFRDRKRLPEGIDGPVRCRPVLIDGVSDLLCGSSTENDGWRVHFERNQLIDRQLNDAWQRIGPIPVGKSSKGDPYEAIQPTLLRSADDKLVALCRTKEGEVARTASNDFGKTWSALQPVGLPNPNSSIAGVTLADGRHLLVFNDQTTGKTDWGPRGILSLAISEDTQTWKRLGNLEDEAKSEFSYPSITQDGDGHVHIVYTWKRQRIKHVVLDPKRL